MEFSWKRVAKVVGVIVGAAAVCAGVYFLVNYRPAKILYYSVVKDDREHFLPCEQLPFYPQVTRALARHQDMVAKLKNAGALEVLGQETNCASSAGGMYFIKGDILIQYHSRAQRSAIQKLLGDTFFGIPYRGESR